MKKLLTFTTLTLGLLFIAGNLLAQEPAAAPHEPGVSAPCDPITRTVTHEPGKAAPYARDPIRKT